MAHEAHLIKEDNANPVQGKRCTVILFLRYQNVLSFPWHISKLECFQDQIFSRLWWGRRLPITNSEHNHVFCCSSRNTICHLLGIPRWGEEGFLFSNWREHCDQLHIYDTWLPWNDKIFPREYVHRNKKNLGAPRTARFSTDLVQPSSPSHSDSILLKLRWKREKYNYGC